MEAVRVKIQKYRILAEDIIRHNLSSKLKKYNHMLNLKSIGQSLQESSCALTSHVAEFNGVDVTTISILATIRTFVW